MDAILTAVGTSPLIAPLFGQRQFADW